MSITAIQDMLPIKSIWCL